MNKVEIDLTGAKILVVDDVPANLDVLCQSLEDAGYNVLVASDGTTALEVAGFAEPDLILLDVMMPGIDGYETCRRLKFADKTEDIPVIFLTARDETEGIIEGFESGGADYVTKPFKKEEILVRIRTHLERARLAQNLAELNAELEQKVEERTREVQLQLKELKGKDRIAEHLLTFHSLEETLAVVLEIIADILALDRVVIYLPVEGQLQPAAAIGLTELGKMAAAEELQQLTVSPQRQEAFGRAQEDLDLVNVEQVEGEPAFAAVPILREKNLLGFIGVDNYQSGNAIEAADLRTLKSFALQAAVAISDAQVRQDPSAWEDQLDEVLELEREMTDVEQFEDIARELDKEEPKA